MTNTPHTSTKASKQANTKKNAEVDVKTDAEIQAAIQAENQVQASNFATELLSGLGRSKPTAKATDNKTNPTEPDEQSDTDNGKKFADFDLPQPLLKALHGLGFTSPTLVQENTLESALKGNDLMVSAQTGSGKTVAFLLPCITNLLNNTSANNQPKVATPKILIICPTRELVQQVSQDAIKLVKHCKGLKIASIMGGMPYHKQIAGLRGAQIVIATPGRLLDLEERNNIDLNQVTHMVLDEADRMLDLGFSEDLAKIAKLCDGREQTLMFSATFAKNIVGLARKLMNNPERVELANSQDKHADITQSLFYADGADHKQALLMYWLKNEPIDQAVIFTPTQVETERLAKELRKAGFDVVDLHGGMRQFMRMKQIKKVRDGKAKILVATDVAARGLDVPTISHVINYGIPMKNEDYVHRIGRTGRAGRQGHAITVATHADRRKIAMLQQFLKQEIDVLEVDGLEPKPYNPRDKKRGNSRRRDGGRGRSEGGYQGRREGGRGRSEGGGYKGKDGGGYKGKDGGGYKGKDGGGYKGKDGDGYKGKDGGGYKGKDGGGYKGKDGGGYKGKDGGGYKGKDGGGYKGKDGGGYKGKDGGGYKGKDGGHSKPKKWEDNDKPAFKKRKPKSNNS